MSHKKSKVPHALIQSRIQQGVQVQLEKRGNADFKNGYETGQKDLQALVNIKKSETIQKLQLSVSNAESQLDHQALKLSDQSRLLSEAKQKILDKNEIITGLNQQLADVKVTLETTKSQVAQGCGDRTILVNNWQESWKWISNWCFGLIVFFATTPIPPELLSVLPSDFRTYLIAFTAFCGLVGRYINQSKK
ncbi:hypothetical protein B9T31_04080 [Acinetobacter sp. ANC 4558]|uniref:DUF7940 domain-containing protein n=1 Tax=Acinetobacter sp. ANC 4558 TaxID=1977876 RepID=UPI000A3498BB|nr:hypothetical protein [Acinetobacter sp. ANC 4558]OTG87683.1 hypothetical protein B9T31_04080 [Acinetobacter sp. ANC 4558]